MTLTCWGRAVTTVDDTTVVNNMSSIGLVHYFIMTSRDSGEWKGGREVVRETEKRKGCIWGDDVLWMS